MAEYIIFIQLNVSQTYKTNIEDIFFIKQCLEHITRFWTHKVRVNIEQFEFPTTTTVH